MLNHEKFALKKMLLFRVKKSLLLVLIKQLYTVL